MQKILFLHSSAELYGSDRSLLNLIHGLDKSQRKIFVFLPNDGPLREKLAAEENVQVFIRQFAVLRRKYLSFSGLVQYLGLLVQSVFSLWKFIRQNRIDTVYTNTAVIFPGAIAAKLSGVRSIWHIREIISSRVENMIVSKFVNLFSDVIIANSKATGTAIHGNPSKMHIIYNAVTGSPKEDRIYERTPVVIGMAGRINHWKGQDLFVEMADIVHKEFPQVKFLIAGDAYPGDEQIADDLSNKIQRLNLQNNVILLGRVSDMSSFYDGIDVFVLPSIQPEPFGLVVIEAMNSALPVIATNHGGPTEIIDNMQNGFLVDFQGPEEMATTCMKLISNPELRKKTGIAAVQKKEKCFSIQAMVGQIESILTSK